MTALWPLLLLAQLLLVGPAGAWSPLPTLPRATPLHPVNAASGAAAAMPAARRATSTRMDGEGQNLGRPPVSFLGSTFGSNSAMFYRQGTLVLEDGTRLRGASFGFEESVAGELVFTTGMVGYPESLTDPSYRGQMLVMTYPIVGNYGVPDDGEDEFGLPKFFESNNIHISALIVSDYSHHHSHWNSQRSLSQWLTQNRVPALYGIDTRLLTKKIREKGALKARIEFEASVVLGGQPEADKFVDVNERNLVAEVSIKEPRVYGKGKRFKVVATDCGIKANIIRSLLQRDCEVPLGHRLRCGGRTLTLARTQPQPGDARAVGLSAPRSDEEGRWPLPLQWPGRPVNGRADD